MGGDGGGRWSCVTQICSEQIHCSSNDSGEAEQVLGELYEPEVATIDGESVSGLARAPE